MIHFDLPKQKSSIIKVIGVGGGGSNAVNFMFSQTVEGVDFIVCNTDAKALEQSRVPNKIQLGPYLTQGLGAGANPEVGKKATEESLEEIKKILEVNTKMAFITVGMGGGTGTGGAPIIAQVCKSLGILTVGIVTTPFSFEGPRRLAMAEEGINELKPHVDTLLVISNDKLRMQYGNLKMREAFGKADNVLATAAKCITDVINSRGHIIVDFADVCTVMKNGGVAILGKAEAEGENRAQVAIEEALSSPLLNDNDITGAKWILININCAEGDDECTMDEIETINNYLRMQAGPNTDVIVGMGYDSSLGKKVGITLIATGFDSKDPFAKPVAEVIPEAKPERIELTLDVNGSNNVAPAVAAAPPAPVVEIDPMAPTLEAPYSSVFESSPKTTFSEKSTSAFLSSFADSSTSQSESKSAEQTLYFELTPTITDELLQPINVKEEKKIEPVIDETLQFTFTEKPAYSSALSSKPTNIYAEPKPFQVVSALDNEESEKSDYAFNSNVYNENEQASSIEEESNEPPTFSQPEPAIVNNQFSDIPENDEVEEQRKKIQERISRLRNLSYNKSADALDEFENVPAYIRNKMELFGNAFTSAENFYSGVTINKEENGQKSVLSTLNTFLNGKKPD